MATISNIIQTIFQSSGANNTNRDIDRVNRNMTRLGQSSASAGRSFAAQSQGLGGLVAAYAGAAATTFALQQAYDKLAQSARQTQTLEGLNTLAARSGESSTILLENVREITKNQLTLAEAASQINLSLSAGFDSTQIEGLSAVALKASRALGRDLNDAYTRVVRGSAKMETELLDELGIYTKIDPATRAYAAAIGKTVGQLTEFERRQAFVNAVIEEGNRKYSSINTTLPTSAEKIEAFGTRILDIGGELGRFLADTLAPLAEFLTNNVTASFSAFGAIASLVASKGVAELRNGLEILTNKIIASGLAAEQGFRKFLGIGKATKTASAGIKDYSRDLVGVTTREKELFQAIQKTAETRTLSNKEIKQASAILAKNRTEINRVGEALREERRNLQANIATRANAIAQARETQRAAIANVRALRQQGAATQEITTAMQIEQTARIQLANATRLHSQRLIEARQAYLNNRDAINGNISSLRALQIAEQGASKATGLRGQAAGLLSAGYERVAGTLGALGNAFTSVVGKALGIFSIISLFTLLGSSIADVLGKGEEFDSLVRQWGGSIRSLFVDSDAKRVSNAIQGITVGVLEELEKTDDELRNIEEFTFTSKVIVFDIEVTKTKADLVREVNQEITGVLNNTAAEADISSWGSIIGGGISVALYAALSAAIPGIGSLLGAGIAAAAGSYIGRIIEDTFAEGELTIGDIEGGQEALDRLKAQYSETFEAAGKELELNIAKGFQNIEERLERQALFDPVARQALQFQKELFAESAKYVNNIESVSQLMTATGKTADVVRKNFTFEQGKTDAEQIVSTLITLEDKEFNLNFVFLDTLDKELKDFLDNATYTVQVTDVTATKEKASGLLSNLLDPEDITKVLSASTIEGLVLSLKNTDLSYDQFFKGITKAFGASENEITNLSAAFFDSSTTVLQALAEINKVAKDNPIATLFEEANNAVNNFSALTARGAENARELIEQLNSGSIDLETFDQRMKAVTNSTAGSNKAYLDGLVAVSVFADAVSQLDEADQATGIKFLNVMRASLNAARENVATANELSGALGLQREELEKIAELNQFIVGITKDVKPLNVLDTQTQLGEVGLDDRAKVLSKLVSLTSVIESQGDDIYKRVQAFDALSSKLREAGIAAADMQAIFTMDASNAEQYVNSINDRKDSLASYSKEGEKAFISISKAAVDASGNLKPVGEEVTFALEELGDSGTQLASESISAMKALIEGAIAELPKLIDSAINDFRKLSRELIAETENIRNVEIPKLKFEAELDSRQFEFDLAQLQAEGAISKLELDLDISALQAELGDITPEADVDNQRRINQEILDKREELLAREISNSTLAYEDNLKLLAEENAQNIAAIEARQQARLDEIAAQTSYIDTLISAYKSILQSQESVNNTNLQNAVNTYNAIGKAIYENLKSGGAAINVAIAQALDKPAAGGDIGPVAINAPDLQTSEIDFSGALAELETAQNSAINSILESTSAQLEAQNLVYENAVANEDRRFELEQEGFTQRYNNLESQRQIEDLNHRARLKDLKDEGSAGGKAADDREKKLKEAQKTMDKFYDDVEEGLKELKKLAADFVSLIFDGLINSKQLEVDAAKIGESLATSVLSSTTEQLNSVQSELNKALSQETSLKDELVSLTERLNESQLNYLNSIKDGDLAKASEDYVDSILEQSRKTVELSDAIRTRTLLESAAQTLEQRKMSAEELAEQSTRARIESEEELARVQEISAGVNSILTSEIKGFTSALEGLAPVIAKLTGQVQGGASQVNNPIEALADSFNKTLESVFEAQKLIGSGAPVEDSASKVAQGIESATAKAGEKAADAGATMANSFASKAIAGISSALQGAGVGSAIGQIMGDDTYASTIGGAVGAGLATVFSGSAFMGSLTAGIGAISNGLIAGAAAASVATLGLSLVGALLFGGLFGGPKKPQAEIRGTATETGFEVTDIDREDGLSKSAANSVGNFVEQVYDSIFTTLDKVGAEFKDSVDVYVRNTEGEFGRVRTTFASGAMLTAKDLGDDAQKVAEELVNEFYQGLTITRDAEGVVTFRSLVVDALTPNAAELQQAIDTFSSIEDINQKTQEQFIEFVEFANQFNNTITKLTASAPNLVESINLIGQASVANATNILREYEDFREQTVRVFGEDSSQLERAGNAMRINALAQIGLAEASDGSVVSIKSLSSEITASRLSIAKTVADIEAFDAVLVSLGFSAQESANLIEQAIDLTLTDLVSQFSTSISDALLSLREPEFASTFGLSTIQTENSSLIQEAEGLLEGLLEEQAKGLDVTADIIVAEAALANARELANLQISRFLQDLTTSQLRFITSNEERFDSETRLLAQQQLITAQQLEDSELRAKVSRGLKDFNSRMADLTDTVSNPALKTGFTSLTDFLNLLGEVDITDFALQFSSAVNSIDASKNLVPQFTSSFELLDSSLDEGIVTTEQYADSLFLLVDTTLAAAESQKELADSYNNAVSSLRQFFDDALSGVQSAITGLRNEFVSLVSGIQEATASIFDIYDSTVNDITSSSNELFDLRDSAREAFEASAEAVKQFEEANSLSGKSAALLTAELESIQNSIDSILSDGEVSFEDFIDLSSLTAQQNRLKRELSAVTALEDEYNTLLEDRTTAAEDLAFIEDTILEFGARLIDSRRTESELIQRTIDATDTLVRAQEDLDDITELLAKNNFNLNQVRQDETDRVYQVTRALQDLEKNMSELESLVSGLLSSTQIREEINSASADLANIISGNIGNATEELTDSISGNLSTAVSVFDSSILPIAEKIQASLGSGNLDLGGLNDIENAFDSLLNTFTLGSTNPVEILSTSLETLNTTLDGIVATGVNPILSTEESINTLVSGILELESAINDITGGGGIDSLGSSFQSLIDLISESINELYDNLRIEQNIQSAFQSILGRPAEPEGLNYYRNIIKSNPDFDIVSELQNSVEKRIIQPAYSDLLGRMPSVAEVRRYKDSVTSLAQMESILRNTQEYRELYPIETQIRNTFLSVLEREPQQSGYDYYSGVLNANPDFDLATNLRNSIEYSILQAWKQTTGQPGTSFSLNERLPIIQSVEANPNYDYVGYINNNFAQGGYVSGPGTSTSDSIPAMLSNGEFVMSAAAVNSVGLGVLSMLNSGEDTSNLFTPDISLGNLNTGLLDHMSTTVVQNNNSDTNIEVNVVNNGTAQQPVSEPTVRRENGKIVVDVILEDIRNNGPIKRTIRSIR